MKVDCNLRQQNISQNRPQQKSLRVNNNPSFSGLSPIEFLRFLDTNQAWGANFVDFGFMVLPRTGTDFTRGADAGWETARRESMGTINDSSVGLYGSLAGLALATALNRDYKFGDRDMKISSVFADSETIDMMGEIWHKKLAPEVKDPLYERIRMSLNNYEVFKDGEWKRFKNEDIEKAAKIISREVKNNEHLTKESAYDIQKILTSSNSRENNFRIVAKEGAKPHTSRYTISSIVENTYKLSKIFTKEKVVEAFENAASDINKNAFLNALKKMNVKRSIIGVLIATAVGCATQPINMYLTKKKTGKDAFVGGGEKDKTFKFKVEKALVSAAFGTGVLASIGSFTPKALIKDLQFKGFTPTIKQLKFIYGATIISRFLAARNENELKEASIKDILGFTNWLILGNFVQKLVAQSMDKTLIKQEKTGGILNWITSSSLKTRDEVLHSALGKDAFKNGKALSFSEMMKAVSNNSAAKKQLKILTLAQLAGYAYSGLVLGLGIPKLNIYLTKRRMAKQAAENANNNTQDNMLKPENIKFLSQFGGNSLIQ